MADVSYAGPFYNFTAVRDETIPGLSYASGSSAVPPAGVGATYNMNIEWSASWRAWDGAPIDTAGQWRISLRTTDGSSQTVDVTPRRVQHFSVTTGAGYNWQNRRVSDNGLVASGAVVADADGLIVVPGFAVSPGGNRLILEPAGGPVNTPTPTATATVTSTAGLTPTRTAHANPDADGNRLPRPGRLPRRRLPGRRGGHLHLPGWRQPRCQLRRHAGRDPGERRQRQRQPGLGGSVGDLLRRQPKTAAPCCAGILRRCPPTRASPAPRWNCIATAATPAAR